MIEDIVAGSIRAVLANYMDSCFVLGLIVAGAQVWRWKGRRTAAVVSGIFLNAFLLYAIGIAMVINFVMHSVFGDYVASTIGWAQSPFQLELALASLSIGIIAIVVHTRTGQFRAKVAVVVGMVVFGLGAAAGHVYQMLVNDDYAVNNTGLLLISDIGITLFGLALVIWHAAARRRETWRTMDAADTPQHPVAVP
jgi:hypothetical protein